MPNPPSRKTVAFSTKIIYPYTGTQYRGAVDKLFEIIWSELTTAKQKKISEKHADLLDILNWDREDEEEEVD